MSWQSFQPSIPPFFQLLSLPDQIITNRWLIYTKSKQLLEQRIMCMILVTISVDISDYKNIGTATEGNLIISERNVSKVRFLTAEEDVETQCVQEKKPLKGKTDNTL